jgi:hypothetical protein
MCENSGLAARIMVESDVDYETIRAELIRRPRSSR